MSGSDGSNLDRSGGLNSNYSDKNPVAWAEIKERIYSAAARKRAAGVEKPEVTLIDIAIQKDDLEHN
jgi:hypothetical protein